MFGMDGRAVDFDAALVRHDETGHAVQGGRLAGAVWTHHREHGAGLENEVKRPDLETRIALGQPAQACGADVFCTVIIHHCISLLRSWFRMRRISASSSPSAAAFATSFASASANRSSAIFCFLPSRMAATQNPLPRRD